MFNLKSLSAKDAGRGWAWLPGESSDLIRASTPGWVWFEKKGGTGYGKQENGKIKATGLFRSWTFLLLQRIPCAKTVSEGLHWAWAWAWAWFNRGPVESEYWSFKLCSLLTFSIWKSVEWKVFCDVFNRQPFPFPLA